MHAPHFHPTHPLALGLLMLMLVLLALATAAPDLSTLDLSFGGGAEAPATAEPAAPESTLAPAWLSDPTVTPLEQLGATPR